tara:strand:+ start:1871 stop:2539 length:669 start_codon:yes stop_codon:yes gene_type:complete
MANKNFSVTYQTLSPFGPRIGVIKLSDYIINKMLKITDDILSDNNRINYGENLAGQIKEEPYISNELLKKENLYGFFCHLQKMYVQSVLGSDKLNGKPLKTGITSMWGISQYENEYNPVHWHEGATLSSVFYLKIPKYEPRNIPGKRNRDGQIVFMNNPSTPQVSLENPMYEFSPEVGDMFIWPSRLMHCVYPFKGRGERRSVAFNGFHLFEEEEQNKQLIL